MPKSLAGKLILSLTLIVVVVRGSFGLLELRREERELLSGMVRGADQLSRSLTGATWHAMLDDNRESVYQVMQTIAEQQGIEQVRIFNKEGRVTFSTGSGRGALVDTRAEACVLCHAEAQPLVRVDMPTRARVFRAADGRRLLGMVTPVYNEPACSDAGCHAHPAERNVLGVLDVAFDLGSVDDGLTAARRRMLASLLLEIGLIGLAATLISRRMVGRPIQRLVRRTASLGTVGRTRPLEPRSSGELGELERSFDEMRARLEQAMEELAEVNRHLEELVIERTGQLETAQRKLLQSERLASLGQLAATVAHEINNPLAGILNLAKLLQRLLGAEGVPTSRLGEYRRYLELVESETVRVARVVADLLAFSRRPPPRRERVDLRAVVERATDLLRVRFPTERCRLLVDTGPAPVPLEADAAQLQQVVTNLVVNAVEASPEGATVTLSTRVDGAHAVLEVSDQGTGIAEDDLPRVFDPFFTTKGESSGVGLGLAVVYGIVRAHDGEVEAVSRPGEGATFRASFPLAAGEGGEA